MKIGVIFIMFFILAGFAAAKSVFFAASSESLIYFAMGKYYFENEDYASAAAHFEKSASSDFEESYNNLAVSHYRLGDVQKAIENFNEAIKINSKYFKAHYGLGLLYFEQKDYSNAISYFKKSLEIENSANVNFDLAVAYVERFREKENSDAISVENLDDLRQAIKYYKNTLEMDKDFPTAAKNLKIVESVLLEYRTNFSIE